MGMTASQIDFILEMYALDHPTEYEFTRPGKIKLPPPAEVLAAWEAKLTKAAARDFWKKALPSAAVLKRAAELGTAFAAVKRVKPDAVDQPKR